MSEVRTTDSRMGSSTRGSSNTSAQYQTGSSMPVTGVGKGSTSNGDIKKRKSSGGGVGAGNSTTTASSRGVANLTAEQLSKKRANDREAQRAIRERTRDKIESLEKEIEELKSRNASDELAQAVRQRDLARAQNDEMHQQLGEAMSLLQPYLHKRRLNGEQALLDPITLPAVLQDAQAQYVRSAAGAATATATATGVGAASVGHSPPVALGTPTSNFTDPASAGEAGSPSTVSNEQTVTGKSWQYVNDFHHPAAAFMNRGHSTYPAGGAVDSAAPQHAAKSTLSGAGERLGVDFLLDGTQNATKLAKTASPHSDSQSVSPTVAQGMSVASHDWVAHSAPCINIGPTCPLDGILLDFLHERKKLALSGASQFELVGPPYPSIAALLYPDSGLWSHPLSKVFTDILRTFPDLSTLPEQIAVLYIMFLIMRWQISPTPENYDRLPDWVTPRATQLFTPHPAWIDHLPWPRMRDVLVRDYHSYPFDNFFIPFTTTISLNWPYEPRDTLISSSESDEVSINPVFERHLRNLNNWSLGTAFSIAFPALSEGVRFQQSVDVPTSYKGRNL